MSRPPAPLPAGHPVPFLTRESPLSPSRIRASDLWAPTAGVRLPADLDDLASRCRGVLLALPDCSAISHAPAGRLLGLPLPRSRDDRLHVIVAPEARIRRAGVTAHRHTLHRRDLVMIDGIVLTSPERTFCDLSESLPMLQLVVVGDHIAHRHGVAALHQAHASNRARRGRVVRRAALEMIDGRSESPKETELRLLLHDAGFGPFALNLEVFDTSGRFAGRVDLALPSLRIGIEYEGDHHRDRDQWRRDIARRRRLEACGWLYIPVTQADLSDPRAILRDLRAAVASRSLR